MDQKIKTIYNLVEHTNLIKKKYDDFAEFTGENYNVFKIIGLYSDEVKHSKFIGNLLNAKAEHGQKDIFLKLFIEEIKEFFRDKTKFENFETDRKSVV